MELCCIGSGVNLEIEERKQAEFYLAEGERLAHMGSWVLDPGVFSLTVTSLAAATETLVAEPALATFFSA